MKQIIIFISALVMLFVCTMASAQSTIKVMPVVNGTVTVDKTSASKGEVVTITVTPNEGYYIQKEDLEVLKTVDPSLAQSRGDVSLGYYVTINGDDPSDVSKSRNYTFTVPDNGYELQVSAGFMARTTLSKRMVVLSPSSFTYNGSEQKPTISIDGFTEGSDYDVTYAETEWKNAGWHSISITGKGICRGTVNTGYYISPKGIDNPIISLSQTVCTYDGSEKKPTVTVKDGNTTIPSSEYTVKYKNNIDVGEASVDITNKTEGNYSFDVSATFNITPAEGNVTPPVGKTGLVYTGEPQDLITAGSSTTGTVRYSFNGIYFTASIPQGVDAEEYTIYYDVSDSRNYYGVDPASITVAIAPKKVSNPTIELGQTSYIFADSAIEPTVLAVKDGSTTIPKSEYTISYSNNINVGTATVTITDNDGGNYVVSGSATFSIIAADGSLYPPAGKSGLVYTGSAQNLITAGSSTTGTMKYSLDGTTYSTSIPQGTEAKEYTIYYKVVANPGYNDVAPASFKVTIAPKTVNYPTITLSQTSYEYDGTAKKPTVTVKDGSTTIPKSEYTVSYSNNTNVGTATVVITDRPGGNYSISGSTSFEITKELSISPVEKSTERSFNNIIDKTTDLTSVVIENTYYTMNANNGDGYDAELQALVLNSTTTKEQMNAVQKSKVGDDAVRDNYSGIIFEVPAGRGEVTVDAQIIGSHVLNVQIGKKEPTKVNNSERELVTIKYNVTEPTYVYLYASSDGASLTRAAGAASNSVLLYGYNVTLKGDIPGDANNDKTVNVADIVKLVNDKASQSEIDEVVDIIMKKK